LVIFSSLRIPAKLLWVRDRIIEATLCGYYLSAPGFPGVHVAVKMVQLTKMWAGTTIFIILVKSWRKKKFTLF
jgi:hypothetical protein